MPDESYDLSPADQRITELREQGLVDAEIAVRTGLPVAEVKARLARLRKRPATSAARLGAEGTAMGKRLLRRRTLLGGLAAAGVGAGAVAFGVALRAGRGGGSPAAGAGSPRPTSTRQPTAAPGRSVEVMVTTSAPTPQTDFPIAEVENPFEVVNFSPGERIEWSRGTFFMNPYSGEITGYRLPDEGPGEPLWFTRAEGDGRYVLATHGTAQGLGLLLERTTGRCWSWPGEELWLAASGYPFFLFMRPRGGGGPSGQYVIADQLLQKRAAFAIDEAYSPPTWVLEGGKA
ncbi:MAG: hypothetical protein ACE5EF_06660, partial [Dehalococcoidia bacterium]